MTIPDLMRAATYDRYGPPEVVRIQDVPVPEPADGEILVEVAATSVNLSDWETLVGRPLYSRLGGLRRPGWPILGSDIAGTVVAIGSGVRDIAVGDEVVGDHMYGKGGFAEYVAAPAKEFGPKPPELSFEQASVIPQSGAIAHQAVTRFAPGDRVLINGAGGSTGSFAIPLAKRAGAHVTAVDNAGKLDFMHDLGADDVVDYQITDVTATGQQWDHVVDLVATRSFRRWYRALTPSGRYRWVGGSMPAQLSILGGGLVARRLTGRDLGILVVREGPSHFAPVMAMAAAGELEVHVARLAGLDEVPEVLGAVGRGEVAGTAVIRPR